MKNTTHKVNLGDSRQLSGIDNNSIDLVVTSPPYPMVAMWDNLFFDLNPEIKDVINKNPNLAFELMNKELDKVWSRLFDVVKPGGFVCINTGDATRSVNKVFRCFNNGSRVVEFMVSLGFINLPQIIWNKPTNSPIKFMGSGTLPAGAYVTHEFEHILIFKKPGRREFDKELRRQSSMFWKERNTWYSNIWSDRGSRQRIDSEKSRERNAAYPLMIPYRLINMYSLKGDVILDPFLGTGTTILSAIASQRSSIGFEIDEELSEIIKKKVTKPIDYYNSISNNRLENQKEFLKEYKKTIKHTSTHYKIPVVSSHETSIKLPLVESMDEFTQVLNVKHI